LKQVYTVMHGQKLFIVPSYNACVNET